MTNLTTDRDDKGHISFFVSPCTSNTYFYIIHSKVFINWVLLFCRAATSHFYMVDIGLKNYLSGSMDKIYYEEVRMESAAFQDDILKPSSDIFSEQWI